MRVAGAIAAMVVGSAVVSAAAGPQSRTVPVGAQLNVLLQTRISSGTAKLDQPFEATLVEKYESQGQVVLASGNVVRGFISSVRPASKADLQGRLTLSFEGIQVGPITLRLRATVVGVFDPKQTDQLSRLGAGPAVGGRVGGGSVLLAGVLVADGGTIVSTNGTDVTLPIGTMLRIRLDQPIEVPTAR